MSIVMSHPTGNQNVRAVANALAKWDELNIFITSLAFFEGDKILQWNSPLTQELAKRKYDPILSHNVKVFPYKEIGRLLSNKLHLSRLTTHETGIFSVDSVYHYIDKQTAKYIRTHTDLGITGIYAYEDGALASFAEAKKISVMCFYDLPIGYWKAMRSILEKTKNEKSEWSETLTGFRDSEKKLARKDKELALADKILVASSFTKKTLENFYIGTLPEIKVIPYGFPPVWTGRKYDLEQRPLKLLFVGGLSQRKGIAEVFEAADMLQGLVTLTVIGRKSVENCTILNESVVKHNYIPSLPHAQILEQMREHDVLLFPSHFEGFGLVITEAMSQGTPVITTDHTVGPDIITHGQNGWIIPSGDTGALVSQLSAIVEDRKSLEEVSRAAMQTASSRTWDDYGREVVQFIKEENKECQ